jgi:hypothetical protein
MRIMLVCTALCVVAPGTLSAAPEVLPSVASFAYTSSHDATSLDEETVKALRPVEGIKTLAANDSFGAANSELADAPVVPADQRLPRQFTRDELCSTAAAMAEANNLPAPFFANLIQQESGFKTHVVSPVGAQGIAQFMPRTAKEYGLENPFDPIQALEASAQFLRELVEKFGNVGLAAAAYNAGPGRVGKWVAKGGKLPAETRHYVRAITGRHAEQWVRVKDSDVEMPAHAKCPEHTIVARAPKPATIQVADASSEVPMPPQGLEPKYRPLTRKEMRASRRAIAVAQREAKRSAVAEARQTGKRFAVASIAVPEKAGKRAVRARFEGVTRVAARHKASGGSAKATRVAKKAAPSQHAGKKVRVAAAR